MPGVDFSELSDAGRWAANADGVGHWPLEDGLAFAVVDGTGEQESGAVASALALEAVGRELAESPPGWDVPKRLRRAVQHANLALYEKAVTVPDLRGMRASITVSALAGATLFVAHVGNCRLLLRRAGQLAQLTKDHTWGWEQLETGRLAPDAVRADARRDALTRSLGDGAVVAIDALTIAVRERDVLVQCSDGIHAVLEEREVSELVSAHPPAPACRALVRRARQEGVDDDVSVQVAAVTSCPRTPSWWQSTRDLVSRR
jgi:protein phosphatase